VQISKKVGARTRAPYEKGSHSTAKSGLNLNFAPDPSDDDPHKAQDITKALFKIFDDFRQWKAASNSKKPGRKNQCDERVNPESRNEDNQSKDCNDDDRQADRIRCHKN